MDSDSHRQLQQQHQLHHHQLQQQNHPQHHHLQPQHHPHHHPQLQQHLPQHHQHQHQQHVMIGTANSYPLSTNISSNTVPAVTTPAQPMPMMMPNQHQQLQIQQMQANSQNIHSNSDRYPYNSMVNSGSASQASMEYSDGSPHAGGSGSGFIIEPARKKRGRPRKYSPDNNIALALSPPPVTPGAPDYSGGSGGGATPSSEPSGKRRGRPPGSGKKQLDALGGTTGVGFTPHVIQVETGQDVVAKLAEFALEGPRTICILSAHGAVRNVSLVRAGGTVAYEGSYELVSMSGTFNKERQVELKLSMSSTEGVVLGGGVVGSLTAATVLQVIVGSFIADGKKTKTGGVPQVNPLHLMNFGGPTTGNNHSPPSQEGLSTESSDDNEDLPFTRGPGGPGGPFVGQTMQNPPPTMYSNAMGWPNAIGGIKMHPN